MNLDSRQHIRTAALSLVLLFSGASQLSQAQCTVPCTLLWADEFDGTSLDLSKWEYMIGDGSAYGIPGWGNNELQYYRGAENSTVAGGELTITAKQENFGGKPYTSSRIRSLNKGDWAYGRYEANIKLPANQGAQGQGTWPAFWMLSTNSPYGGGWPYTGEIDIMEWLGHDPRNIFATLHYPCCGPGNPTSANDSNDTLLPLGTTNDWHTYAVEWEPTVMRWYRDGILYSTKNSWNAGVAPFPAPFDVPFHFLLNMAIGGNFPGAPDGNSVFPQEFKIDWVRVYDMGATITPPPPPLVTDPIVFDDFETNNAAAEWYTFTGPVVSSSTNVAPENGGTYSMAVSRPGGGTGYAGGFGRVKAMDLSAMTQFSFWINPTANQDYDLQLNIQDDDTGEGSWSGSADDEFQFICTVSPTGPCAIAGGGWQLVTIPIEDFVHDTTFATGGTGILDTEAGGNGQAANITVAVINNSGAAVNLVTDYWLFEGESEPLPEVSLPIPFQALAMLGLLLASTGLIVKRKKHIK